ncbi:MAG TPA: hypothetical protein VH598_11870, partial [Verrucomicrobiae bacterium]|nr:hypothetical protein [Verrucomicrobiae bacterium]
AIAVHTAGARGAGTIAARAFAVASDRAIAGRAFRAVIAGELRVTINGRRFLRPSGQEKFFQIKIRFWRCTHATTWPGYNVPGNIGSVSMDWLGMDCKHWLAEYSLSLF